MSSDVKPSVPPHIYPEVPKESPEAHTFRLQQITHLHTHLENEINTRNGLTKKYRRAVNVLDGFSLKIVSLGSGIGGVGLLATVVAAPIVIGLESAAPACGLASIGGKFLSRKMACKEKKHAEIAHIEVAKLNTIHSLVSRAMVDSFISDDEFRLIISEIEKYNKLKEEIRTKANKRLKSIKIGEIDEATKKPIYGPWPGIRLSVSYFKIIFSCKISCSSYERPPP